MGKYLIKRILFSILSLIVVVGIVMLLVYTAIHRNVIFQTDDLWNKKNLNDRTMYEYSLYQKYGYLTYVEYGNFLKAKYEAQFGPEYDKQNEYVDDLASIKKADTYEQNASVQEFKAKYEGMGYKVIYLEPVTTKTDGRSPAADPI